MTRMRRKTILGARFPGDRAGNAGLIATVAMAFAGVLVGALSAYLGQRGATAAAIVRAPSEKIEIAEDPARAERDRIIAEIVSGAPERLRPPEGQLPAYVQPAARPKIVIILDDMGVDRRNSERALNLPGPVTYSFLPYAGKVNDLAQTARKAGAEVMLHLPMEPRGDADPGPHALKAGMTGGEFLKTLEWNLDRFAGYTGVNNHMGSKLTEDIAVMKSLLGYLDHRGVFFLDSVTTPNSAARQAAKELGVEIFARDVFLDNDVGDADSVKAQLSLAERIARETGYVVAIGHPHPETLEALGPWLTTAPARGYDLIFASGLRRVESADEPQAFAAAPGLRL
ncbi:divergent polysaccharide deacetylase family protein [Marinicaulis aureus]|uniref:Divergent polysaccharide deacetylase family protein n=1 Tax=Hyphococcus aureus TaxID=2666033 RepID=A0ABW1KXR2_9PROT